MWGFVFQMANTLHRFTYFEFNTEGRRVKRATPWHPNLDYLQSVATTYYAHMDVKFETITSGGQHNNDSGSLDSFFDNNITPTDNLGSMDFMQDYSRAFA